MSHADNDKWLKKGIYSHFVEALKNYMLDRLSLQQMILSWWLCYLSLGVLGSFDNLTESNHDFKVIVG